MTKENAKIVQVYVKENFYNEIKAYCKSKNISISAALRIALKEFIDSINYFQSAINIDSIRNINANSKRFKKKWNDIQYWYYIIWKFI